MGAKLASVQAAISAPSIADARASNQQKREAEQRLRNAEADLESLAPDGIDALRDRLAQLPVPSADEDDIPSTEEAQQEDEAARKALVGALEEYEALRTAHGNADTVAGQATITAESAATRLARATTALSGIDEPQAERIARGEALSRLRTLLEAATLRRKEAEAAAPDLNAAAATLERARSVVNGANEDRQCIRIRLGKLDTSIGMQAGEAVDEELADIDVRLTAGPNLTR